MGHERVQLVRAVVVLEEPARRIAEHRLVFAESEVLGLFRHRRVLTSSHFDFGNPSTRSPRMLRWISLVPAAIVPPKLFMYASG